MKKKILLLAMTAVMSTSLFMGCGNQVPSNETETNVETQMQDTENNTETTEASTASVDDLAALPAYGANPDYDVWTTLPYLVEDAAMSFTATISADKDLKKFEVQCNFFEDQIATVEYENEELTTKDDKTGFMKDIAPEIVKLALEQDIWLPVSECTAQYGVFSDPGDNPTPVNQVVDDRPLYIQAGVWDDDFTRTNDNLNGLATNIKDETLVEYEQPCDTKGTVEAIEYDTYYYAKDLENGDALSHKTPITKTAYVYLPADYDTNKQYNILYLLHGGGDTAEKWFSQMNTTNGELGTGYAVNILDHVFADGKAEPFIVVTPGLYNDADESSQKLNGYTETFAYELKDLMPVVESSYSTYAEDVTEDELIVSRDHRALAGLSMGSITTWHSGVAQSLDTISWFGNMSGGPAADIDEASSYVKDTIIPAIEQGKKNGYDINMLLSMNGVNDIALDPHVATHKILIDFAESNDALNVGENYDFIVSNGAHNFEAWNLYLYDLAQVFFK